MAKTRCILTVSQPAIEDNTTWAEDTVKGLGEARWDATQRLRKDKSPVEVHRVCPGEQTLLMVCKLFRGATRCRKP